MTVPHDDEQPGDGQDPAGADVDPAPDDGDPAPDDGLALLRRQLTPGADERDVARAVDEHLRRRAPGRRSQQPDTGPRRPPGPADDDEPLAVVTSGRLPQSHRHEPARELSAGDAPVSSAGGTPDSVGGDEAQPRAGGATGDTSRPDPRGAVVLPDTQGRGVRLGLGRVQMVTLGVAVTATVVLRDVGRQHTGVCEAVATPGGDLRSLATATAQAMESAAGGRCRIQVEAVEITAVSGRETAVVVLSIVSDRGTEVLTGACPVGDDSQRATVKAVLAASNRRMSLQLAAP